jgi:hypothetical protein
MMLIPQQAQRQTPRRQGCRAVPLAELRRRLATPSDLDDETRQRLLDLGTRLAGVQALGDEYARVSASDHVVEAINQATVA